MLRSSVESARHTNTLTPTIITPRSSIECKVRDDVLQTFDSLAIPELPTSNSYDDQLPSRNDQ